MPNPFTAWLIFVGISVIILILYIYDIWKSYSPNKYFKYKSGQDDISRLEEIKQFEEFIASYEENSKKRLIKLIVDNNVPFQSFAPHDKMLFITGYTDEIPDSIQPGDLVRKKSSGRVLVVTKCDRYRITTKFVESSDYAGRFLIGDFEFSIYDITIN